MLTKTSPSTIVSDEGWQVEVLGRAGIRYTEAGKQMRIDSEVLAGPAGMAVYSSSIRTWLPPHENEGICDSDRARIVENVRRAFKIEGFDIHVF